MISASIISCINYKFCRVRVAGTGDAALAKAGITGKSPTPAARSQASAGAPDLDATVAMLVAWRHRDVWRRPRPRLRATPPEAHRQNIRRDDAAAAAKDIGQRAGSARRSSLPVWLLCRNGKRHD